MFACFIVLVGCGQRVRHLDSTNFRRLQGKRGSTSLFPWWIVPTRACGSHRDDVLGGENHNSHHWYSMDTDARHSETDYPILLRADYRNSERVEPVWIRTS